MKHLTPEECIGKSRYEHQHLESHLPTAEYLGMAQVEQSDIYVDYTHWMDNVDGQDWKFNITHYLEDGTWDTPDSIIYQNSEPGECFEDADSPVPLSVRTYAESVLAKAIAYTK